MTYAHFVGGPLHDKFMCLPGEAPPPVYHYPLLKRPPVYFSPPKDELEPVVFERGIYNLSPAAPFRREDGDWNATYVHEDMRDSQEGGKR